MLQHSTSWAELDPEATSFYLHALRLFRQEGLPFLIGGAYAFGYYTGIARHTKDFDIFVRPDDARRALDILSRAGYKTELTFSHWLGKAFHGDDFVDVIFCSGNGMCRVDDDWFRFAVNGEVLGVPVKLMPAEEMIWQKAYIMERERFDGADVLHLLRARGPQLDWDRLLARFGPHSHVLLSHLVLFGFVYPDERDKVPAAVLRTLTERMLSETTSASSTEKTCFGTLLSREQYLTDTERQGYRDARVPPLGNMTAEELTHWTAAIKH